MPFCEDALSMETEIEMYIFVTIDVSIINKFV